MDDNEFFVLVKESFDDLLTEFSFGTEHYFTYGVQLKNEKCIVNLTYDRGEVGCTFSNPTINREAKYHAYQVYKILYPFDKAYIESPQYNIEKELRYYNDLMVNRLRPILLGDFSWTAIIESNSRKMSRKIEFLINKLPAQHPVRKKFWNGDLSWQKDIDDLLK